MEKVKEKVYNVDGLLYGDEIKITASGVLDFMKESETPIPMIVLETSNGTGKSHVILDEYSTKELIDVLKTALVHASGHAMFENIKRWESKFHE